MRPEGISHTSQVLLESREEGFEKSYLPLHGGCGFKNCQNHPYVINKWPLMTCLPHTVIVPTIIKFPYSTLWFYLCEISYFARCSVHRYGTGAESLSRNQRFRVRSSAEACQSCIVTNFIATDRYSWSRKQSTVEGLDMLTTRHF